MLINFDIMSNYFIKCNIEELKIYYTFKNNNNSVIINRFKFQISKLLFFFFLNKRRHARCHLQYY